MFASHKNLIVWFGKKSTIVFVWFGSQTICPLRHKYIGWDGWNQKYVLRKLFCRPLMCVCCITSVCAIHLSYARFLYVEWKYFVWALFALVLPFHTAKTQVIKTQRKFRRLWASAYVWCVCLCVWARICFHKANRLSDVKVSIFHMLHVIILLVRFEIILTLILYIGC